MKKYRNLLGLIIIFGVYFLFVELVHLPTRCFIKNITGLPCPGCGLTRAYEALFHGHLASAFFYHPLFWFVPIIFGLLVLNLWKKNERLRKISNSIYVTFLVVLVIVYIVRMIQYFPHSQPMNYNKEGLYPRIVEKIIK